MADEEVSEDIQEKIPKKKKSKKLLIIIIVVILLIVIIVGVFFIFFTGSSSKKSKQGNTNSVSHLHKIPSSNQNSIGVGNTVSLAKVGVLFPLDTFIVNLVSSNHQRYLKTQMSLELSNKDLAAELKAKEAVVRNRVIGVLSSKTYQQISTIAGKNKLAQEIANAINPMLSDGSIEGVFFTEFVVQ